MVNCLIRSFFLSRKGDNLIQVLLLLVYIYCKVLMYCGYLTPNFNNISAILWWFVLFLNYVLFLRILYLRKLIYEICALHDIAEILLKLVLNTYQSILFFEETQNTRRKPQTCHKYMRNFHHILVVTSTPHQLTMTFKFTNFSCDRQ